METIFTLCHQQDTRKEQLKKVEKTVWVQSSLYLVSLARCKNMLMTKGCADALVTQRFTAQGAHVVK